MLCADTREAGWIGRQGNCRVGKMFYLVEPLPEVQIRVAYAAVGDFDQDLGACGLGDGEFDFLKGRGVLCHCPGGHGFR